MLSKRQNLLETIRGGHPDRYVNQYEAIALLYGTPYSVRNSMPAKGGALHLYDATNKMLIQDRQQIEQLEKAVTYTKALFQSAQSTYLEILSAQQSLLGAQLTEVSDNVQRMQAVINLYSALGGGRE